MLKSNGAMEYGQVERRPFLVWKIKGSNPFTPINIIYYNKFKQKNYKDIFSYLIKIKMGL